MNVADTAKPRFKRDLLPYQIVIGVIGASIGGIVAVLGEVRDQLGFSETAIGLTVAFGFLGSFVSQVGLARFADRGHGRKMAVMGVALSSVSLLAMVVADDVLVWSITRATLGFGGGLTVPGLRRAATVLDPANVGENLGRLVVGEVVGFIFGPVVAAVLVVIGGFRAPFLVFGIGMAMFIPFVFRMPADSGKKDESGRKTSFDLLRVRRLQGALILVMGYFMLIGAWEAVIPVMFNDRGGSATTTGIAFTLLAVPIVFISTWAGRTADRIGPPKVAIAGMLVVAFSSMSYGFLPGLFWPVAVMILAGFADGLGFTAAQVAVSRSVTEARQAGALGLMGATEVLGAGLAAIPAAVLYERSGERVTWVVVGIVVLLMVALGAARLHGTKPATTAESANAASC